MPQVMQQIDAAGVLSERDAAILDFEKSWWTARSSKEQEIRERFDLSSARYYQILNTLIDRPEALEYDPLLVKRLRRLREQRHRDRSAHRLAR
ncbi:DUF3263 domain-containing protein [Propionibacterium australiense]|uniref:DUF3263 domain-containing protein n=1 Tax=Propionibacterium australiense TaxID=119981 RepID=A0A383S9D4_9ACTN|nr:DUF3263 domain-containing protein [Propionibacterium australiense]RLP06201.1 DUF3263 domain-containing protein [Propionibacterium australiense]RLP06366.1 DUF3263 domain-containing protein [Propionibacterium australiense]SYZ34598.1 Protein of unknown function DUF3263 [Propionibacterium australiense]VEH92133.1 Protein of uncharacterised function (DUF3263) [Propionibacterium australiense]